MANNNTVALIGNLGQDPKSYSIGTDDDMVVLSIATTDSYKDEQGNWQEKKPVWHTAMAFSPKTCDYARAYRKGDRVKVTGALSYRTTSVLVEGEKRNFSEASIVINRIDDARLPRSAKAA